MIDSDIVKALFTLLRSGLWDRPIDDLTCFPLSDKEWKCLYKVAESQTIEALIYDGVQRLPFELLPNRELLLYWVVKVNAIEQKNVIMNACIKEQVLLFNKLGVDAILLKGQGVASYYPNELHRVCGDIDWYFHSKKDSKNVQDELSSRGVQFFSSTVDSVHYLWRSCEVEQHTKLFDVFNPFARYRLNNIVREKSIFNKDLNSDEPLRYRTLPANLNIVQVNLHILKHLLSFGIGLRQFCDSAILYAELKGKYDEKWLFKVYSEIGILKWIYVLHDLLVEYIGLSENSLPFKRKINSSSRWMMEEILITGNFGFYDDTYTVKQSNNTIERKNKSRKLFRSFQQYFPLAPYEAISFPVVHFMERFRYLATD